MKKMKKIIALLMILVMMLQMIPVTAYASFSAYGWDDWEYCDYCGHGIRSDYICEGGNHCSVESDDDCYWEWHCQGCGACLENTVHCFDCLYCKECIEGGNSDVTHCASCGACDVDLCPTCTDEWTGDDMFGVCYDCAENYHQHCWGCDECYNAGEIECCYAGGEDLCKDCCIAEGFHCEECGKHIEEHCWADEDSDHCVECAKAMGAQECSVCGTFYCDSCGVWVGFDYIDDICNFCVEQNNLLCPECGFASEDIEWCSDGGEHCIECCDSNDWICEQCGRCTEALDIEICGECGLCIECCLENAEAEGCSCGEYCIESSDWDEHFCENCGTCFDDSEQCEICGLCEDCCEDNSECSQGLCVEDSEYATPN